LIYITLVNVLCRLIHKELKRQAETLRDQNRFSEAVAIYEKLWQEQQENPDIWVGWGYAQCLRKIGRSKDALEVCRAVYQLDPTFERNNNLYGWCTYDIGIKQLQEKFDEAKFLKAANAITQLTRHENYSPYERTVFAVVHHYEGYKDRQKPVPHAKILEWLDKLNPALLSSTPNQSSDGKSYPSPKEDWYSSRAKALLGLERYQECIVHCTNALNELRSFHYDYDVWFRQYRAESFLALGAGEKALPDLEYMIKRKSDAWIRHRYALGLYATGQLDAAIRYASEAALPNQRLGYRWEVYLDLGNMLLEYGEQDLAVKHVQLAVAIRQAEGWAKIPDNLQAAIYRFNVSLENLPDAKSLHRDLEPYWRSMKPRPKTTHTGVILEIHSNGKSGRIQSDDGKKYFFGMKNYRDEIRAASGLRVCFNLQESENNRTGAKEMHAVDIRANDKNKNV
jgi:tetratricopeptide (TPR) repeat protein